MPIGSAPKTELKTETQFQLVDRMSPEIMNALAKASVYKKVGLTKARLAVPGEIVTTIIKGAEGDIKEMKNTAKEGDRVVAGPLGEEYLNTAVEFPDNYEATDKAGWYLPKTHCRAIPNPLGRKVKMITSWGPPEYQDERCFFACKCDENGKIDTKKGFYFVAFDSFIQTYKKIKD